MREIKFRAWDIESKAMLSWDDIQEMWEEEGYHHAIFSGDHYVPLQYTGLKDSKGVEIYEGDIVRTKISGYWQTNPMHIENIWDLHIEMNHDDSYYLVSEVEVIGNIYENPELLDGEK